ISARSRTTGLVARLPGSVQAACRVTLEVERDELVAGVAHEPRDAIALPHQTLDFGRLDLDPRDVSMVADTHLRETKRLEGGLRGLDLAQGGDRHLGPVWDA